MDARPIGDHLSMWDVRVRQLVTTFSEPYTSKIKTKRYYEITYCVAGEITYHIGTANFTLRPGDLLLLRPGETFTRTAAPGMTFDRVWIGFEREWLERIGMERLLLPFESDVHGQDKLLHPEDFPDDFWRQTLAQLHRENCDTEVQLRTCTLCLLWSIYEVFYSRGRQRRREDPLGKQIVSYVNASLQDNATLDELTTRFHISRASLYRLFKAETGESIGEYISKKRLQLAREMMLGGVIPKRACQLSGFRDYSTFYRAYKRRYGISPSCEGKQAKEK
ncbi:MAG: helix-turn-helix transcriptional regulator [Oscillospiraceae bacterium]|nr:helix-turn-helix transcriptional regulator [Oscillospiraceae bacterium]